MKKCFSRGNLVPALTGHRPFRRSSTTPEVPEIGKDGTPLGLLLGERSSSAELPSARMVDFDGR